MSGMLANIILIVLLVVIVGSAVWYIHKEEEKRRTLYWMPISRILYTLMYAPEQKEICKKIMQRLKGMMCHECTNTFNRCHYDHAYSIPAIHQYLEASERGRPDLLWRCRRKNQVKKKIDGPKLREITVPVEGSALPEL